LIGASDERFAGGVGGRIAGGAMHRRRGVIDRRGFLKAATAAAAALLLPPTLEENVEEVRRFTTALDRTMLAPQFAHAGDWRDVKAIEHYAIYVQVPPGWVRLGVGQINLEALAHLTGGTVSHVTTPGQIR
jgi:hypothetical protein